MAKNTLVKKIFKFNWQESYASLILGAIIVIILGLLVANYFTRKNQGTIDEADMTKLTQEEETKPVEGSDYKIKENDSLSKISQEVYGSQEYWNALAVVNNIVNPNVIWVNTTIKLPDKDDLTKTKETLMGTSYEVQEGEIVSQDTQPQTTDSGITVLESLESLIKENLARIEAQVRPLPTQ